MIDINNSQDYDSESLRELVEERRHVRATTNALAGVGAVQPLFGGSPSPLSEALGVGASGLFDYSVALDEAKAEITDPVRFMLDNYPGQLVPVHPHASGPGPHARTEAAP
jgi:hypothetical protein